MKMRRLCAVVVVVAAALAVIRCSSTVELGVAPDVDAAAHAPDAGAE